jgi:ABC-type ATPase with predicted acetyltransferase domain
MFPQDDSGDEDEEEEDFEEEEEEEDGAFAEAAPVEVVLWKCLVCGKRVPASAGVCTLCGGKLGIA